MQPSTGGEARQLTTATENVQLYSWSPDGNSFAYSAADAPTNAAEAARGKDNFEVGNGSITLTAPPAPDHLWLVSATGGQPARRLTSGPGGLPDDSSAPFAWAPDGRSLVCVLRPSAQTGDQETTVGPSNYSRGAFYGLGQAVAARGYVVFQPNYRGRDNLGYAFQRAIREDAGAGPGRDVLAGIAMLEKRGWVDTSRIALSGASYGGFLTAWLMGESRRWRCAVARPVFATGSGENRPAQEMNSANRVR